MTNNRTKEFLKDFYELKKLEKKRKEFDRKKKETNIKKNAVEKIERWT